MSNASSPESSDAVGFGSLAPDQANAIAAEGQIDHMALDGTTLANLEILYNSHSNTVAGSLWSKINFAKSPHGSRLLKGWLLRPLFRKADIDVVGPVRVECRWHAVEGVLWILRDPDVVVPVGGEQRELTVRLQAARVTGSA